MFISLCAAFGPVYTPAFPRNGVNPNKHIFARRQSHLPGFWLSRIIKRGPLCLSPPSSVEIFHARYRSPFGNFESFRTSNTLSRWFPQCDFSYIEGDEKEKLVLYLFLFVVEFEYNNNNNNNKYGSRLYLNFVEDIYKWV